MFYRFIIILIILLSATFAFAECEGGIFNVDRIGDTIEFCWDKNSEQFLGGYRLYRKLVGHQTWEFYQSFDTSICDDTTCETGPMIVGTDLGRFDWSVTAFDIENFESDNSNTVEQLVQEMQVEAHNLEFGN